ncbi:MAG: hypothetical protein WDA13_04435 [Candidatus Shapirobacteria bacterium]
MNYLIVCNMRTGSSYLGELIERQGLPYWNELFTAEICRRRGIWPPDLDDAVSDCVLDRAYSVPGAGFKLVYGQATPKVWARLALVPGLRVIHIIRETLLEQYASVRYLETAGVSMAREDSGAVVCYGTDGAAVEAPGDLRLDDGVDRFLAWRNAAVTWRMRAYWLFSHLPYLEIHMEDVFTDEGRARVCGFLGLRYDPSRLPDHVPTPRPCARELFSRYAEMRMADERTSLEDSAY